LPVQKKLIIGIRHGIYKNPCVIPNPNTNPNPESSKKNLTQKQHQKMPFWFITWPASSLHPQSPGPIGKINLTIKKRAGKGKNKWKRELVLLLLEGLDGLGARVVELAGLADGQAPRSQDQHLWGANTWSRWETAVAPLLVTCFESGGALQPKPPKKFLLIGAFRPGWKLSLNSSPSVMIWHLQNDLT